MLLASVWPFPIQARPQIVVESVFITSVTGRVFIPADAKFFRINVIFLAMLVDAGAARVHMTFIIKKAKHGTYQNPYPSAKAFRLPGIASNVKWNTDTRWTRIPCLFRNKIDRFARGQAVVGIGETI